jgi:hypothetical protein
MRSNRLLEAADTQTLSTEEETTDVGGYEWLGSAESTRGADSAFG